MKFLELKKRILTSVLLIPLVLFLILFNNISFILLIFFLLLISFFEWNNINKKKLTFTSFLGFLFILSSFLFSYYLKGETIDDITIFVFIIFVCIFSDIGGYVFGNIIGGIKLTKISPNKTYSGSIGSFIFSALPIFIINFFSFFSFTKDVLTYSLNILIFSLSISFFCQIGDLSVSYFKRVKNVKDSGNILPGHGGILDRIDGLLFAIWYCGILKFFEII